MRARAVRTSGVAAQNDTRVPGKHDDLLVNFLEEAARESIICRVSRSLAALLFAVQRIITGYLVNYCQRFSELLTSSETGCWTGLSRVVQVPASALRRPPIAFHADRPPAT